MKGSKGRRKEGREEERKEGKKERKKEGRKGRKKENSTMVETNYKVPLKNYNMNFHW
jgi:hypothetical protein